MKLQKTLIAAAMLTALAGCSDDNATPSVEQFDLTIAHVNDTHSSFDPSSLDFTNTDLGEDFVVRTDAGGYPRVATKLKASRDAAEADGQPFLALHAGDAFQGSLYFNLLKGDGNAELLNQMGLDAATIGNHEFDMGNEPLIDFINKVNFPVLAANLDTSADSGMNGLDNLMPYTIKEVGGQKVGIIGLVLEDMETISSPGEDLVFMGEVASAQATVDALSAEGVDKIILLSHIGLDRDLRIAQNVNGVDVIVGGHSHTLLGDFTNLGMGHGDPEVDYAEMITNPDGGQTCIVQSGESAEAVGQVDVSFTDGAVTSCEGHNTLLVGNEFKHKYDGKNREALTAEDQAATEAFVAEQANIAITEEDAEMRAFIDTEYAPMLEEFNGKVIGQVFDADDPVDTGSLDHTRIPGKAKYDASLRYTGSEAGAHVAEAMVWKLNKHGYGVDMAITNNGGIRNPIVADETGLTAGYVVGSLLYFNNELAITHLTGADITDLLEDTINYSLSTSSGAFPTFANLQFTFNGLAVAGAQIEDLQVCPGGVAANACADIELDKVYKIATNAYIAGGKDGYTIFAERAQQPTIFSGFIDNESMIEYVEMLDDQGLALEELPTGLNFIEPADFVADNPLKKDGD